MPNNIAANLWGGTTETARPSIYEGYRYMNFKRECEWRHSELKQQKWIPLSFICFGGIHLSTLSNLCHIFFVYFKIGWILIIYGHKLHAINFTRSVLYMFRLSMFTLVHVGMKRGRRFLTVFWCPATPFSIFFLKSLHMWRWERAKHRHETLQADS